MIDKTNPMHKRCIKYMDTFAEQQGIRYELEMNELDEQFLESLKSLDYDELDEDTIVSIKTALRELVLSNEVCYLQGVRQKEPQDEYVLQEYSILFNKRLTKLGLKDVVYSEPVGVDLTIEYDIHSDDEDVLKLMPGVQLGLFDGQEV